MIRKHHHNNNTAAYYHYHHHHHHNDRFPNTDPASGPDMRGREAAVCGAGQGVRGGDGHGSMPVRCGIDCA